MAEAPFQRSVEADAISRRRRRVFRVAQVLALAAVAGLLGLLIFRVIEQGRGAHLVSLIREGKKPPAPAFSLPVLWNQSWTWPRDARGALADRVVSPLELQGHPVVVNFWASWCIPCKAEAPLLAASARAHQGRVVFLGIDVQDFSGDARHFLRRFDTPYVSVRDGPGSTYDDYGLTGVPETYWFDARGRIVAHYAGQINRDQLEAGIRLATGGSR